MVATNPMAHSEPPTPALTSREHFKAAVSVLTQSFYDSPQFVATCPDPHKRKQVLPIFFGVALRDALAHGYVDVILEHEAVVALALWLPPGSTEMTPVRQARAAFSMLRLGLIAPRALRRLAHLGASIDALHPSEPHAYLQGLAVHPSVQGRGYGSRLLLRGLGRADAEGWPCYLETMTERNVRLYERFGFRVMRQQHEVLPGGPPFWFMWRPGLT